MKLKDNLAKILIPILSILIAFIAGGIIILCLGKNPVEAYGYLFSGAFGSGRKMGQTLVIACPLIFTGLAAAFAYKCGVFLTWAVKGSLLWVQLPVSLSLQNWVTQEWADFL